MHFVTGQPGLKRIGMLLTISCLVLVVLAGCGKKTLSGTYTDSMGMSSITFDANGKCKMAMPGMPTTLNMTYKIEKDKMKFSVENQANPTGGAQVQARELPGEATLSSDMKSYTYMNMTFTKKE